METYFYKCKLCGFLHIVPAYWVDFNPPLQFEQPHLVVETGQACSEVFLELQA